MDVLQLENADNLTKLFLDFEIKETLSWIFKNSYRRVALQFPEHLFNVSPVLCLELQRGSDGEAEFAILAEKKYGSCCVDEIGAEHFVADCIVHYGMTCLSPHPRLPVRYVFTKKSLDVIDFSKQMEHLDVNSNSGKIKETIIVYNLAYHHTRNELIKSLNCLNIKYSCPEVVLHSPWDSFSTTDDNNESELVSVQSGCKFETILGRRFDRARDLKDCNFVYIGDDDSFLATLMVLFTDVQFILYEPWTRCLQPNISRSSKMLMKRYYMMEKARDANFVGILVGTLDVSGYVEVIEKIKSAIKMAGKRFRVYSPGTLNPAKLANLADFDVFVLVACPLNTFIDTSDYYRPIVTPYEMLLACSSKFKWCNEYKLDFKHIISEPLENDTSEVTMDISLVSGRVRKIGIERNNEENDNREDGTVVERIKPGTVGKASDFLNSQTWQGLQPKLGETPVSKFIEGSLGTASGYYHEIQRHADEF